jgi:hypothetical protein
MTPNMKDRDDAKTGRERIDPAVIRNSEGPLEGDRKSLTYSDPVLIQDDIKHELTPPLMARPVKMKNGFS